MFKDTVPGGSIQHQTPDWEPLLDVLVDHDLVSWFMWMYEVELADGARVHAYKHQYTRRYMFLATDGGAYAYCRNGEYLEIPTASAIEGAFETFERYDPPKEDLAALRAALSRARAA